MPTPFKRCVDGAGFSIEALGVNSGFRCLFGVRRLFKLILKEVSKFAFLVHEHERLQKSSAFLVQYCYAPFSDIHGHRKTCYCYCLRSFLFSLFVKKGIFGNVSNVCPHVYTIYERNFHGRV